MDDRTKESSITILKRLRDVYQSQLDTRVVEEIDSVIAALEDDRCNCPARSPPEDWRPGVLRLIAEIIRSVTNISDWMN